ncbi:membrane protein [Cytophagales bacterium WSM2-2]|nr:membrane protein [Cytophagales bacterium WSM2-2]
MRFFTPLILLFFLAFSALGQETIVTGKITDAATGDPIPYVNVVFNGTGDGVTTNFEGHFRLRTLAKVDSITASFVGYITVKKAVVRGTTQVINFQFQEAVTQLHEVVVTPGINPAFAIMRNVIANKNKNDKRSLNAYEYDAYSKMELDIDHITEKFRKRKVMKKIASVLDSVQRIAGEDGKPILPLFITESVSKFYFRENPSLKKEIVEKSKISGVGVQDGTMLTQLIGSSLQEYNFYQNWLSILRKEFVSPIADGWRLYYKYDLMDSMYIDKDYCYKIDFYPQSPEQLAFTGSMWITKNEFAVKQIDATVSNQSDVNFIDRIKIQQELTPTVEGPWMPTKNRVLIDIGNMSANSAGMIAKFYTSKKNIVTGKPRPASFYEQQIEVKEDARMFEDEKYWDTLRHEPLSATEKNVYKMIDTLKNIPMVKTYADIVQIIIDGHVNLGKVKLGPYLSTFAWNTVEGFRVQAGFKTTYQMSKHWIYQGYGAYGFDDDRPKFQLQATRVLSTKRWTSFTLRARSDIMRIGVDDESQAINSLFRSATRWGNIRRGFYFNEAYASFQSEIFRGFTQRVSYRHRSFTPTFEFGYKDIDDNTKIYDNFNYAEVVMESRYAPDELFIKNHNERVSVGTFKKPVIVFRYTRGLKSLGSHFDYDKIFMSVSKRVRMGPLGMGRFTLSGEHIFNDLPYPLLAVHLGNRSHVYTPITYNLMNFGEFVSDQYASLNYQQFLDGFLLNRLPLIHKLKWRFVATGNVIFGGMRKSNQDLISEYTPAGKLCQPTGYLTYGKPYVEVGYGVENIFHFLRVDFVHRLTYLDRPNTRSFGVLFTAQLKL